MKLLKKKNKKKTSTVLQKSFKTFFLFIDLVDMLSNGAEWFEQFWWKVTQGTFLTLLQNLSTSVAGEIILSFFLFIPPVAILFNRAEWFEQFW